jgi:malate/lactate dehydrogenase
MVHQLKSGPPFAEIYKVKGYGATPSELAAALKGSEIVLIPAGVPRKPGMTRDGTFDSFPVGWFHD